MLGGGNASAKTPATPVAPQPVATAKPPAPPPPVSTPQTQVQLPPPQAVSPSALATIPPVREELPAPDSSPAANKNTNARKPPAATVQSPATKPEPAPAQTSETPAPIQGPPTPPTVTPAEEQPRLQPVYPEEDRRRILGELDRRKNEIDSILRSINPNRMSADQRSVVQRIHSFINVADDSAKRGDFRSADALSERALILARELASGR
jgi:hypothetical protein